MILPEDQSFSKFNEVITYLNSTIKGMKSKISFIQNIESGNLDSKLELLSDDDLLGRSLLDMQKSLVEVQQEQEKQREKESKTSWANEGYALFAGVLQDTENLQKLTDESIKNIVKYLDVNQGAIFLAHEEDDSPYLEVKSTFAWNRHKFISKRLAYGESLAGSCMLEKQTIVVAEVPDDYVTIASGLGEANPNCIIVVPLKTENRVLGVVELASFRMLEDYQIQFVERVAENIATAINTVRINDQTQFLLEQTKQQSEEMAAQEEEMRQNMEELVATQEEMQKKETMLHKKVDGLKHQIKEAEKKYGEEIENLNSEIETLTLQLKQKEKVIKELKSIKNEVDKSKQPKTSDSKPSKTEKTGAQGRTARTRRRNDSK